MSKTKKIVANVFVGMVNAVCFLALCSLTPAGFILGGLGVLGVIGQVMLNKQ